MAIFSSIIVNRHIKSFLACEDMTTTEGVKITNKLASIGKDGLPKLLEAMDHANDSQKNSLKVVCHQILKNNSIDLFLDEMENDSTIIRLNAKEFLCDSQGIELNHLLNRLLEPDAPASAILDVLEAQKNDIKTEQLISLALKTHGKTSKRLFKIANQVSEKLDLNSFQLKPSKVDSPDKKIHVLEFLGRIKKTKSAQIVVQFVSDPNNMVKLAALNSLRTINQPFNALPLLQAIPTMKPAEVELAISLVRYLADDAVIGQLAPLLTSSDEQIKEIVTIVIVEKAQTETFRQLLIGIEKREEWARNVSINSILDAAKGRLSHVAKPLLTNNNEFIKRTAAEFVEDGLAFGNTDDLVSAALHKEWQIRDKAIKKLGQTQQKSALGVLYKVIKQYPESTINSLKAIASLGFSKGLEIAVRCLAFREVAVQREALKTIGVIVNQTHAQSIQKVILHKIPSLNKVVSDTVEEVLRDINKRFNLEPLPKNLNYLLTFSQETEILHQQKSDLKSEVFNLDKLKPGVVWANRYEVIKEIGRGAMGRALLAKDKMVDEQIVIKFMNPELTTDETARERFVRELKFARKISHSNVIRIHDFLYENNIAAISMEYFDSCGLDEIIEKGTVYTEKEGLLILSQILSGMQAAHNEHVIHRDLKPSNILVNGRGNVKVVDFGIASAAAEIDSNLTKMGTIVGTPSYISPERAKGEDSDHRADIYAVGIITYYMLTGNKPYNGEAVSLLYQHIKGKAEPVHLRNKLISRACSDIVAKMMAVNPDKRYQNMRDVQLDIDKII